MAPKVKVPSYISYFITPQNVTGKSNQALAEVCWLVPRAAMCDV